jgi:hypothetical protein
MVNVLMDRSLPRWAAELAADYCEECLDVQEKQFESEREPFA